MIKSKSYRCYLVFCKGSLLHPTDRRKGKIHWVVATNPQDARDIVERKYLKKEMRKGEWHDKTVAAYRTEDVAMREQGHLTLFD